MFYIVFAPRLNCTQNLHLKMIRDLECSLSHTIFIFSRLDKDRGLLFADAYYIAYGVLSPLGLFPPHKFIVSKPNLNQMLLTLA